MLVELLALRGSEIAKEVATVGELVAHTLENRGSAIVSHLSAKHDELTAAIDQSSAALSHALETSASASVGTLIGANDKLKSEMTSVLDRLSQTNSALQSIIGNAGQNLAAIESALSERVKDFQIALARSPRRSSR